MAFSSGVGSHDEGHVAVCYSADGQCIISGGAEGDIKIYKSINQTEVFDNLWIFSDCVYSL